MTMIFSGKPPSAGAAQQTAARAAGHSGAASDKRFAGMLGRMDPSPPLTFRRSPDQSGEAVSFAAMPLVAPVSLTGNAANHDEMKNLPVTEAANTHADVADHQPRDGTASEPSLDEPKYARAPGSALAETDRSQRAAVSPVVLEVGEAAAASLPVFARVLRGERPVAATTGWSDPAGPSLSVPLALDLGSGITVHLAGDADNWRIWVRGARIEAEGRGDIKARIVKLMRGHGMVISEQAIEFDGGRNG